MSLLTFGRSKQKPREDKIWDKIIMPAQIF